MLFIRISRVNVVFAFSCLRIDLATHIKWIIMKIYSIVCHVSHFISLFMKSCHSKVIHRLLCWSSFFFYLALMYELVRVLSWTYLNFSQPTAENYEYTQNDFFFLEFLSSSTKIFLTFFFLNFYHLGTKKKKIVWSNDHRIRRKRKKKLGKLLVRTFSERFKHTKIQNNGHRFFKLILTLTSSGQPNKYEWREQNCWEREKTASTVIPNEIQTKYYDCQFRFDWLCTLNTAQHYTHTHVRNTHTHTQSTEIHI